MALVNTRLQNDTYEFLMTSVLPAQLMPDYYALVDCTVPHWARYETHCDLQKWSTNTKDIGDQYWLDWSVLTGGRILNIYHAVSQDYIRAQLTKFLGKQLSKVFFSPLSHGGFFSKSLLIPRFPPTLPQIPSSSLLYCSEQWASLWLLGPSLFTNPSNKHIPETVISWMSSQVMDFFNYINIKWGWWKMGGQQNQKEKKSQEDGVGEGRC